MATVETMTIREAVERMRALGMKISDAAVTEGLKQKVSPFGDCVISKRGSPIYTIYTRLFDEWVAQRAT